MPCHKTPYRCPHRLNLSSLSSRSCAGPNIKVLKDKDLEFANSIRSLNETLSKCCQKRLREATSVSSSHLTKHRLINSLQPFLPDRQPAYRQKFLLWKVEDYATYAAL